MSTDVCALTVYALHKPCMYVLRYCVDSHNIQQSRVNGGRFFRAAADGFMPACDTRVKYNLNNSSNLFIAGNS